MLLDLSTQRKAADYRRAQLAEEFRQVGGSARHARRHRAGGISLAERLLRLARRHRTIPPDRLVCHSASPDPAR